MRSCVSRFASSLSLLSLGLVLLGTEIGNAADPRPVITSLPEIPAAVHGAMQDRDFAAAVERIEKLLDGENVKDKDYLRYLKGRALAEAGKLDEATAAFKDLEAKHPKSRWLSRSRFGRADVLVRQRNYRAAGLIYQAEAKRLLSADRRDELAGIYLEFADRYYEGDPDAAPNARKPDFKQALTYYQESLKLKPGVALRQKVELRIAHCQRELKEHEKAIVAYQSFLRSYTGEDVEQDEQAPTAMVVQARFLLGRTQLAANQRPAARRTWQDFLASDVAKDAPEDLLAETAYRLAHTWGIPAPTSVGNLELGVASHERFLKEYPDSKLALQAQLEIAQSYAHHARYEAAVEELNAVLEKAEAGAKQIPLARNLLGQALAAQKKFPEAIAAWRTFLDKHPSDANWSSVQRVVINTEYTMAQAELIEKNYDKARELWAAFLNRYPLDNRAPQILFLFGHMKHLAAMDVWRKQIEAADGEGDRPTERIEPNAEAQKLFQEAIADWQRVVSKYPNTKPASQAAFAIGTTLEDQLAELEDALKAYRKVKGPLQPTAQQRISRLTAKQLEIETERKFNTSETAHIKVTTRNVEAVSVRMYRIDMIDYFRKQHLATGVESLDIALIDPDKTWEHKVDGFEKYGRLENEIEIPVEGSGVTAVTVTGEKLEATTMVVVSDLDIIVKSSRNELFVFAQNSRTGEPQPGTSLLVSDGQEVFAEELAGDDGILQKTYEQLKSVNDLRVFAVHEGHAASTVSNLQGLDFAVGLSAKGYLFTDRPAYRPGQLVNLKGIVRWVSEDRYVFKAGEKYQLDVYDARGRLIHTRKLALNKFGALADNFELPESSPEGTCRIHVHQPGGEQSYETDFLVHEYQLPSLQLTVETNQSVYYRGDTIEGTIRLKYYYGTPLARKTIHYRLGDGREYTGKTNRRGRLKFSFPTREFRESQPLDIVAEFREKNVSGSASVQLATRGFAINVSTLRNVFIAGETFDATITVSDPAGNAVGTDLTLEILERTRVNGRRGERTVETFDIKSDKEEGEARRTLRIDSAGDYIIRASGTDQFGNRLSGSHPVSISGDEDRIRLRVLADRHQYKVGDKADIQLHWREGPALALVTYEGASILGYQLVPLKKGSNKLTVPMDSKLAPNFNLGVAVMHANQFHEAGSEFRVARRLNIVLKPNRRKVKPGEELSVEIITTDPQGKPVSAEVSLGLVQNNLWQLFGNDEMVIDQFFGGGYREPRVRAASSCTFQYQPATQAVNEFLLAEQQRANQEGRNAAAMSALRQSRNTRELAGLVDRFNDLYKQRRFQEAERIASRAAAVDPDNPVVVNMKLKSQFAYRIQSNERLREATEQGFWKQLDNVEWSAVPFDDASGVLNMDADGDGNQLITGPAPVRVQQSLDMPSQQQMRELLQNRMGLVEQGAAQQGQAAGFGPVPGLHTRRVRGENTNGIAFGRDEADYAELRELIAHNASGDIGFNKSDFARQNEAGEHPDNFKANLSLVISQTQDMQSPDLQRVFENLSKADSTIVALNNRNGEFQVVNGLPVPQLEGLAGDGLQILPRMASAELGYWNPTIVTNRKGKATLKFRLPDRSTAWTLKSQGVDADSLTGQAEVEIIAKKDLFGELRTPLAFTAGDKASVQIAVHNSVVEKDKPIQVVLKTTIGERSTEIRREVKSPGSGVVEVEIPIEAIQPGSVEFELTVSSGELTDTSNQVVPVNPYGVPVFATASGTSAQSTIVFVEHDKKLPVQDAKLELMIGPSIDRTLLESLLAPSFRLSSYRSSTSGLERSISDVLGGISLLKLIGRSRENDSPEAQAVTARVNAGIARLVSSQRDDGGWSWSGRHAADADRYITSRAVWALSLAKRGGFSVPAETLQQAIASLKTAFTNSGTGDREGQAIILHGLAEAGAADFAFANRLYRERNNLSPSGLLHVALTLIRLDRKEMAEDLIELVDLPADPGTANQPIVEPAVLRCIPWMQSSVELRALHLLALEELFPTDKAAAETADWLLAARFGHRWELEKSNGPALMALAGWFSQAKFSSEKYTLTVQVNDKDVQTIEVDPAADATRSIDVPAGVLLAGKPQKISVQMQGQGRFSYSAILSGFVAADKLQSTSNNWRVTRIREPAQRMLDGEAIPRGFGILTGSFKSFRNPLTQLPVGERADVTLQVRRNNVRGTKDEQLDYLVIEEPLPAGTSVIHESIQGQFERYEIGAGSITFYLGAKPYLGDIRYKLAGHLTGNYRTVPTVVRSFYRPERIAIAASKPLEILPQGEQTVDEYKLTPVELYEFGKRRLASGQFAEAGRLLTELFGNWRLRDNIYKETVQMLFRTSLATDEHHATVKYFEIIKEKYPDVEIDFDSIMKVATAYQELGEYERSYLVFRATIEGAFERESQIAGFLNGRNEFVRSVEVMERLLHEYPAESYIATATFALAGEVYTKSAAAGDDQKLKDAGITRVDLIDSSVQMHDHLLSTWPSDPASDRVSFSLASAVLDLEQYEDVIARSEDFAERFPKSPLLDSFWYVIGYSQFALGNHDAALEMCRKVSEAVRKDPQTGQDQEAANKWQAVYILGQIYHSLGKPAEAIAEYERVKDRFSDATEAIEFFTRKDISLPEVTTVAPGDDGKVELSYRNVKEASIKVYRIDLLKFGLMQRNLDRITAINLAGIRPYHEQTTELGAGLDYRDRKRELKLPLKEEGAYLVVCRGENLYSSGLVLVSPLKLEIQEDATSGRVRVTVKDSVKNRYLRNVLVKVIGSVNEDFNTGETDLRGIFVADGIQGTSTIIARADEDRYAFFRGEKTLGSVAQPAGNAEPQSEAAAAPADAEIDDKGGSLLRNVIESNSAIQRENGDNFRNLINNSNEGVKAKAAF